MVGLAQKLFFEKEKEMPWKKPKDPFFKKWPLLENLHKSGYLSYIDLALAEQILKKSSCSPESTAALISHLSIASRSGHLCVKIENNTIYPPPKDLWTGSDNSYLSEDILKNVESLIIQGVVSLTEDIFSSVTTDEEYPLTPICQFNHFYYLQRFWLYENIFFKNLKRIDSAEMPQVFNEELIAKQVSSMELQGLLLPEQAKAILNASKQSLAIICGGPGTGKTYTAGQLIKILYQSLSEKDRQNWKISLAAPTGKAAANLEKSLHKAIDKLEGFEIPKVTTLHALLKINKRSLASNQYLEADLVLVDECSMIDVRIMSQLLNAIKPGARLIFLGDKHQLPPVEAGSLFSDMINYYYSFDKEKHPIELKKCMRAELQAIIHFAEMIKKGDIESTLSCLQEKNGSGVERIEWEESDQAEKIYEKLTAYASPFFINRELTADNPQKVLQFFDQFRILSPLRQGPFGVEKINQYLLNSFTNMVHRQEIIIPIMIASNNAELQLFNGETGVLIKKKEARSEISKIKEGDYAIFPSKEGAFRRIPALLLPKFEYAYCISVHKSQGSEFDNVLLLLPKGSEQFGREVFYTGATRAKKKLTVWGSNEIIRETILKESKRLSGMLNVPSS